MRWWQSYLRALTTDLNDLPAQRRAEVALSIPVGPYRLVAHCDLIAADDDRAVIVDWKTEHRRPTHEQVLNRLQTRVYRYVVTEAQQRAPGAVSMLYWFAEYPDQPEVLPYDARQHAAGSAVLRRADRRDRAARAIGRRVAQDRRRSEVRLLHLSIVVQSRRGRRGDQSRRRRVWKPKSLSIWLSWRRLPIELTLRAGYDILIGNQMFGRHDGRSMG